MINNNGNKNNKKTGFLNGFNLGNAASSAGYWYGIGFMAVMLIIGIVLLVVGNNVMKKNKNNSYSVKFFSQVNGTCEGPYKRNCDRYNRCKLYYECNGSIIPDNFPVPINPIDGVDWQTSTAISTKTFSTSRKRWGQNWEGDPATGQIRPRSLGRMAGILLIVFGSLFILAGFGMVGCLRNRSCRQGVGAAGVFENMFGGSSGYDNTTFNPLKDL